MTCFSLIIMRKEVIAILEDIGLSQTEASVYAALVDISEGSIGEIVKQANVHRTNAYQALERLIQKGLVSYVTRNDAKFFSIKDPTHLLRMVKEKEEAIERILPELLLPKQLAKAKGEATIYEGIQSFQRILDHFLTFNEPILVYGIPKDAPEQMKHFIVQYHKRRIAKKILMQHIYNYDAQERITFLNTMPYTQAKSLPQRFESFVSTNICGDEVVLVMWAEKPFVVQIKNAVVADSYKKYFAILWNHAKVIG